MIGATFWSIILLAL